MKILVSAWRHWTAARRFRSLLLNAPKAGHEVWGLATNWIADQDLTIATFNELGVEAFGGRNWKKTVEALDPDVVFAEYRICVVEKGLLDWVNEQGKVALMNNHVAYLPFDSAHDYPDLGWIHIYYMVDNHQKAVKATTRPLDGIVMGMGGRFSWAKDHVFVLGSSDLDFITEKVDVAEVRNRLGVKAGQPLIGVFPSTAAASDRGEILNLVAECQNAGMQVVVHLQPIERRLQNSQAKWDGFYIYDRKLIAAHFWPEIQAMGARFIADYAPGRTCGVEFHRCQSFELIRAADCLIGVFDIFFEAYALGKGYSFIAWTGDRRIDTPGHEGLIDRDFELQDNFTKVSSILERGNDLKQHPAFVEYWFFKLDGLWWKRALDLAERLVGGIHGGT